jgi:hypothetical protein
MALSNTTLGMLMATIIASIEAAEVGAVSGLEPFEDAA